MPNVELRWSDYRGSTFRIVESVDDGGKGMAAIRGKDVKRGLYELDTDTVLIQQTTDESFIGGKVQQDGSVQWAVIIRKGASLAPLLDWTKRSLAAPNVDV